MLNLRIVDPATSVSTVDQSQTLPGEMELEFAHGTIIGNIGAPLRTTNGFGDDSEYLDEETAAEMEKGEAQDEDIQLQELAGARVIAAAENMQSNGTPTEGGDCPASTDQIAFVPV